MIRLVNITDNAEQQVAYCARVSSPNQENPEIGKLISYCIKNKHWSIFENTYMTIEIETCRAISAQILRHRSFTFQEFSQRYAKATEFCMYKARRQDDKNRQSSIDDMKQFDVEWFHYVQEDNFERCMKLYNTALSKGIAKEQARFLLPMSTKTKLYMSGNLRSWIHYIELRSGNGTQQEHADIALAIKDIFIKELPIISESLGWIS